MSTWRLQDRGQPPFKIWTLYIHRHTLPHIHISGNVYYTCIHSAITTVAQISHTFIAFNKCSAVFRDTTWYKLSSFLSKEPVVFTVYTSNRQYYRVPDTSIYLPNNVIWKLSGFLRLFLSHSDSGLLVFSLSLSPLFITQIQCEHFFSTVINDVIHFLHGTTTSHYVCAFFRMEFCTWFTTSCTE